MSGKTVFVVDDNLQQRKILSGFLDKQGYSVRVAPDAETALKYLDEEIPDLVLMDVKMPGMGGIEGLAQMRKRVPALLVILLTAYSDVRDVVNAMRQGAVDYLEKPVDLQELRTLIAETIGDVQSEPASRFPPVPEGVVFASPVMQKIICEADLAASTDATVLITGESGTGKEEIAKFIHWRSKRSEHEFVPVNCAAIPQQLVESELFGHVKGAFTGADSDREGRFEAAEGGTILLDELGDFPLELQPKLLRVLEDGSYQRVGESVTRHADVRVVASTNQDLEHQVEEGRFREDLFWRLNVFQVHLPPLRERIEEVKILARTFLDRYGKEKVRVSPAALRILETYHWPGNIRELANVIERAAILVSGNVILPEHLPKVILDGGKACQLEKEGDHLPVTNIEEAQRRAIREALNQTNGNREAAAKLLGISRRTLFYRLKRYNGMP